MEQIIKLDSGHHRLAGFVEEGKFSDKFRLIGGQVFLR